MANRYWVGGTGSWNGTNTANWSTTSGGAGGASIPTTADDVFIDGNSGTGSISVSTGNTGAKSLNLTGYAGLFTGTGALTVAGSVTYSSTMTTGYLGVLTLTGAGSNTITTAGNNFPPIVLNAPSGTYTLADALSISSSSGITITAGTFDTNGYSVTAQNLSSSNSNTRAIYLRNSSVTLTGINTIIMSTLTGMTFDAGTSSVTLSGSSASITFQAGQTLTFNTLSFSNVGGTFSIQAGGTGVIACSNLFLPFMNTSGTTARLGFNCNANIGNFVASTANAINRHLIYGVSLGTRQTITCGSFSGDYVDFQCIEIAGAAAPISGAGLGNAGNNAGITFSAGVNKYWNKSAGGNWSDAAWALTSGGAASIANFPLPQDTVIFDTTGLANGSTISMPANYVLGSIDMSARVSGTYAMTLSGGFSFVCGNWINGTGVTTSSMSLTFQGFAPQSITSAGKTFQLITISSGSTVKLMDALTVTVSSAGALTFTDGTLDLNGYTLTVSGSAGTFRLTAGTTNSKNITFNGGSLTINGSGTSAFTASAGGTGFTTTAGTGVGYINMTSASGKTFVGNSRTYNCTINQAGAGALTISGTNTFSDITNSYKSTGATTITFANNQTFASFSASGLSGKVLTINSSAAGTARTLTKSGGGTVSVDYMSIQDSIATGGSWYAGANSTNVSNNTGWIFTAAPPASTGNFICFF